MGFSAFSVWGDPLFHYTNLSTVLLCFYPFLIDLVTRHTLVWKGILVAVFFLCPITDISVTVAPIGVKCLYDMMVYIGPGQIFSPFGSGTPMVPKIQNFGPLILLKNTITTTTTTNKRSK